MMEKVLLRVSAERPEIVVREAAQPLRSHVSLAAEIERPQNALDPDITRKCAQPSEPEQKNAIRDFFSDPGKAAQFGAGIVIAGIGKLGIPVTPSVGNFLLMHFPAGKAEGAAACDDFLKSRGIILRRVAGYGLPNSLRLTVGTEDENRAVVDALAQFMKAVR